jgi:large conductance mechanosensitive channel
MFKEFKEFATRGNIMDLAVGVVIGGAFQAIVNSLVNDIIMPAISIITGNVDFSNMAFTVEGVSITYGNFITAIVNFLIIAFSIFLAIKYINTMNKKLEKIKFEGLDKISSKIPKRKKKAKKEEPKAEPTVKICPYCFTEINIKATRCPHCTSELHEDKKEEA